MANFEQKVLVIGDSCLDNFVYGTCDRVCPEAPVPVFKTSRTEITSGMAKNVAHNLDVLGIPNDCITNKEKIIKNRYVDIKSGQLVIRVDEFDECPPIEHNIFMAVNWVEYDLVVISDYCKGFLSEKDIATICQHHSNVFLDTKKILGDWVLGVHTLKINETEYNTNKKYLDKYFPKDRLIITLGDKGCEYNNKIYPIEAQEVKNSSGAGDAFLSGLIKGYLKTKDLKDSIKYAQESAAIVVSKITPGL